MIDATDTCPGLTCCDTNYFSYEAPGTAPALTIGDVCSTCQGSAFSQTITATGIGPALTWSIVSGALPTGLTFHGGYSETGTVLIDGTPSVSGGFSITVQAVNTSGVAVIGTFKINVLTVTTASLPDWQSGIAYSAQLQASGGSGNYAWKLDSGTLPDGLVLDVSGLIHGTPTGLGLGTNPLVFDVIDITCEESSGFFIPNALLSASSVTTFLNWIGYSEFIASTPPKKYRTITFTGTSERVAFTCEQTPHQCGGAKYVYSGVGQIDVSGNQISNYSKKFYAQCSKQFWPAEPLQENDNAITTGGQFPEFVGFCWGGIAASCGTCDPNDANWPFIGEVSNNLPTADLNAFMRGVNDPVVTPTSWSINAAFHGLTSISMDTPFSWTLFGTTLNDYSISVGASTLIGRAIVTNPSSLDFPNVAIKDTSGTFHVGAYINFTDTNNYSAVLSDEFTDADAQAHAVVVNSNSRMCENLPRTTGFTSKFTTVNYGITCGNLIVGASYKVQVDFLDSDGTLTTLTEVFQAGSITHVVNHNINSPPAGMTRTVLNPRISFV